LLLWDAQGYESDDLIATACSKLQADAGDESELSIDILTGDKDLMALVNERVTVVSISDGSRFTPIEVETKMGVPPALVSQLLALTGDKADNVPGCPGVGPKKAAQLLADNDGLTKLLSLFEHNGDDDRKAIAQPATLAALKQNLQQVAMSWKLVTLMTDAPIDIKQLFERRDPKQLEEIKDEEFGPMQNEITTAQVEDDARGAALQEPPIDYEGSPGRLNAAVEPRQSFELRKDNANEMPADTQLVTNAPVAFEMSLEPNSTGQAWALSKAIFSSRLFAVESPAAALMILMTGREMGIGSMSSLRGFHFIKGKPCMSAQLMSALILRSGKAEYWELIESNSNSATYATKRIGGRNDQKKTFSVDDARLAKLVKEDSNWIKYPAAMCEARACSALARIVYPDLLMGVYTEGELDD